MLLPLLMNVDMFGGDTPPPAPDVVQQPSGGYPDYGPSRRSREEQVRRERIRLGILPDDLPPKAVRLIEQEVARQLEMLEREDQEQIEDLRLAFQMERQRWRKAYEDYYRAFVDAMVTLELREHYRIQRRKRLMVFVLMNT